MAHNVLSVFPSPTTVAATTQTGVPGDAACSDIHGAAGNRAPFRPRPIKICFAARESKKPGYREHSSKTACELYAYVHRACVTNPFGEKHDFIARGEGDFAASEAFYPVGVQKRKILGLWRDADRAAAHFGPTGVSSLHFVADLPPGDLLSWLSICRAFVQEELLPLGLAVEAVIHEPARKGEAINPHVHFNICLRHLTAECRLGRFKLHLAFPEAWDPWKAWWVQLYDEAGKVM